MIEVGLLTNEQAASLVGQKYTNDSYFNPIQDKYNNWIITQTEMFECINEQFMWVKDLPLIPYVPISW